MYSVKYIFVKKKGTKYSLKVSQKKTAGRNSFTMNSVLNYDGFKTLVAGTSKPKQIPRTSRMGKSH